MGVPWGIGGFMGGSWFRMSKWTKKKKKKSVQKSAKSGGKNWILLTENGLKRFENSTKPL